MRSHDNTMNELTEKNKDFLNKLEEVYKKKKKKDKGIKVKNIVDEAGARLNGLGTASDNYVNFLVGECWPCLVDCLNLAKSQKLNPVTKKINRLVEKVNALVVTPSEVVADENIAAGPEDHLKKCALLSNEVRMMHNDDLIKKHGEEFKLLQKFNENSEKFSTYIQQYVTERKKLKTWVEASIEAEIERTEAHIEKLKTKLDDTKKNSKEEEKINKQRTKLQLKSTNLKTVYCQLNKNGCIKYKIKPQSIGSKKFDKILSYTHADIPIEVHYGITCLNALALREQHVFIQKAQEGFSEAINPPYYGSEDVKEKKEISVNSDLYETFAANYKALMTNDLRGLLVMLKNCNAQDAETIVRLKKMDRYNLHLVTSLPGLDQIEPESIPKGVVYVKYNQNEKSKDESLEYIICQLDGQTLSGKIEKPVLDLMGAGNHHLIAAALQNNDEKKLKPFLSDILIDALIDTHSKNINAAKAPKEKRKDNKGKEREGMGEQWPPFVSPRNNGGKARPTKPLPAMPKMTATHSRFNAKIKPLDLKELGKEMGEKYGPPKPLAPSVSSKQDNTQPDKNRGRARSASMHQSHQPFVGPNKQLHRMTSATLFPRLSKETPSSPRKGGGRGPRK